MPNTATGLLVGFGTAEETVYGTAVAPDRAFEILSEGIGRNNKILQSNGLRRGTINLRRSSRRVLSGRDATGPFSMEVPTTGFGRILKHLLGGTPTIAQQAATTAWLQTHTLGSNIGKSLTVQKQLADPANTLVQQFTAVGGKIPSGTFKVDVDNILTFDGTLDCRDLDTTTAVAALTYPTNNLFHFGQVSVITVGGSTLAKVNNFELTFTRPMKTDGYYLGSTGLKSEPVENDFPTITGKVTAEFDSANKVAIFDRYVADTGAALVLTFEGATISGIYKQTLTFNIPLIHFTNDPTPKVSGPDMVLLDAPFEAAYDGSSAGATVTYTSTDTAV